MRGLGVAGLAGVAACTVPNPAWLLTESETHSGGGSSAAAADATAAASETGATSDGRTTTEGTAGVTSGGTVPATSETSTSGPATSTSGPDITTVEPETTGVDACVLPIAQDIGLTMTTDDVAICDEKPRTVLAEVLGPAGANRWKFNVCGDADACLLENATCGEGEHVIFTFDGPQELAPTFVAGDCHEIVLVPLGPVEGDAKSCSLRLLRFGHTRYTPPATLYVGAVAVPGTSGLSGNVDWLTKIGFDVVALSSKPCVDPMNCMPPAGSYDLRVTWDDQTEHLVAEGESFVAQRAVLEDGLPAELKGTFTSVRARIELGPCLDERDDFKWVWLAPLP